MLENVGVLATYSEFTGKKKTMEEIKDLVNQMALLSSFVLLSQISTGVYDESKLKETFRQISLRFLNQGFKNNPPSKIVSDEVYKEVIKRLDTIKTTKAFSPQSILNMWKWLLAYGNKERLNDLQDSETNVSALCYISLMTNDYLYQGSSSNEELYAELFSNYVFNHHENTYNAISRTFLIYTQIAQDRELYDKGFLDINADFYQKYKYSIRQHLAIVFGITAVFLEPDKFGEKWIQNIDNLFSNSKLNDIAKDIITSLKIDIEEASIWAEQKIESPWNFQKIREQPLLMINDKEFLPFSLRLLEEQLFAGLFHKVRHAYLEEDKRFLGFFGKPFEKYAQILLHNSIKQTKVPYKDIPEFRYRKNNDSPDIMLRLNNKLLAIEVKSYRLRLPSITDADVEMIDLDTEKMIISPLKQVHNRVQELIEDKHKTVGGVDEIYFMVVTQGHYPTLAPYEQKIDQELAKIFTLPVKGYYHLDIEEFEMLCSLIERKHPIFNVLDNKNNSKNKYRSFKNFLISSYHVKRNKLFKKQFEDGINEIKSILFDKTD